MAAMHQGALISETTTLEHMAARAPQGPPPPRDERKGSGRPAKADSAALYADGARVSAPYGGAGGAWFAGRVIGAHRENGGGWR